MKMCTRRKFKLNNKGNTLGIVIIGIFILSILGTLILGLTATNYKMKLVDKKSESTFYYAEKAVDEVYAGIGKEVMNSAQSSYQDVLENFVDIIDGSILANKGDEAELMFRDYYISGKADAANPGNYLIDGLQQLYKKDATYTELEKSDNTGILDRLEGYVSAVSGYNIHIGTVDTTEAADKTAIQYLDAAGNDISDPAKIESDLNKVVLKNVCVECETANTGFYSSIITDFEIKVPNVNFDVVDTGVTPPNVLDDFCSYTLIAQGSSNSNQDYQGDASTISVNTGSKVSISGNVYAGMGSKWIYTGNSNQQKDNSEDNYYSLKRNAFKVYPNAELSVETKNFVCDGPFVVAGGNAFLRGTGVNGNYELASFEENENTLNFYASDVITQESGADLKIVGNCLISDDMEVNGIQNKIAIKGRYFGYGFQAQHDADITTMENRNILEADSGITEDGFLPSADATKEHEKRSAIIINGKQADVDMSQVETLVLGGRAYIDLDSGMQYGNASYMTGESISFKGNQQMYLADRETGLKDANSAIVNPMGYTDYNTLKDNNPGLPLYNDSLAVAKKSGDKVYFYNKQNAPIDQTSYFINTYNNSSEKKENLEQLVKDLGLVKLSFSNRLEYYTVGAFMSYDGNEVILDSGFTNATHRGFTTDRFYNLIKNILIRKSYLTPTLKELGTNHGRIEDMSVLAESKNTVNETVFNHYVDSAAISANAIQVQNLQDSGNSKGSKNVTYKGVTKTVAEFVRDFAPGKTVGFYIDNNTGTGTTTCPNGAGVWISNVNLSAAGDFEGLLICNGRILMNGNVNVEANEELIKFMLTCDDPSGVFDELRNVLKVGGVTNTIPSLGINADSFSYQDIVAKKNWRKNTK